MRAPAIFAVHGIDEGDALALATRTAAGYAYRARQALFWNPTFSARDVLDQRRGLLRVDGFFMGANVSLVAMQFSDDRAMRIRELRSARTELRTTRRPTLLFVNGIVEGEPGFADLGFATVACTRGVLIAARAFSARGSILRV